jgi:hypothetical protein
MDRYIARLKHFLGADHKSTQGFTIIRDFIKRGDAPAMGIFYAGKNYLAHDLILYAIGEDGSEFKPVTFDANKGEPKSLLDCLEKAAELAGTLRNPPRRTDHLVILALDQAAMEELQTVHAELSGNGNKINDSRITYVSVPLVELKNQYEDARVKEAYHGPEEPLSPQAEAIRQGMLARLEKAPANPEKKDLSLTHISAQSKS